jgi:hypothetical protein
MSGIGTATAVRGLSSANIAATCRFIVPWMRVCADRALVPLRGKV